MHHRPGCELMPLRVAGARPAGGFIPARITEGRFIDTGEKFKRVDTWTAKATAQADLGRRWTGSTRFLARVGESDENEDEAAKDHAGSIGVSCKLSTLLKSKDQRCKLPARCPNKLLRTGSQPPTTTFE